MLDRTLEAVAGAEKTVIVGPQRPAARSVTWTLEDPPGGGPVAGIDAGLVHTNAPYVVILGVDFPFVDDACVARLVEELDGQDGVILIDDNGRHQGLVGAYKRTSLLTALGGSTPRDMAVKELLAGLDLLVLQDPRSTRDCDTWDDVRAADEVLT